MKDKFFVEIKDYEFSSNTIENIEDINFIKGYWPLVYILHDNDSKTAYIGETTDAVSRMSAHLRNSKKKVLKSVKLIMSDRFNKSATLDIESSLIRYMAGDGQYSLLNGNIGIANHTYYQQRELYIKIFKSVWSELQKEGLALSSLNTIDNSDLYKYSPYKSLTVEQKKGLIAIIRNSLAETSSTIMVEGGAGTGKSILAIYFFKLLHTDPDELDFRDFGEHEFEFVRLVRKLQLKYPDPKVGLVIPMSGFRNTIKKVFKNIHGLNANMVIGPAEVVREKFDILMVDESHRLRQRINLGAYFGAFDKANAKIGLQKDTGNELDWIVKQSEKRILFYDINQSIKPSDVPKEAFAALSKLQGTEMISLKSQLRALGGNDYVDYVDRLLSCRLRNSDKKFEAKSYDFKLYKSLPEMIKKIEENDKNFGLSRLVAGYSWKWLSKNNENTHDIEIGNTKLKWNSTNSDWINSDNAISEVGCIHTTQGYDLNYVGVIFGKEIIYNTDTNKIEIISENYHDKNGKNSVRSEDELKQFVINIYKTMMLRGIKGTYVFACDPNLSKYFEQFILLSDSEQNKIVSDLNNGEAKLTISPYQKTMVSIPLYDSIGCGDAMHAETVTNDSVDVPQWLIKPGARYFALRTKGDSMNQLEINDGDIILCQKNYQASSGSNAVVIIGDDATLKQIKYENDGLVLIPKSTNPNHRVRKLTENDEEFKVLGVFVCKLDGESTDSH